MKYLASSLLLIVALASVVVSQNDTIVLRNGDILLMVESKVPAEAIVTKIKNSTCNFDTFLPVLLELKRKGVPDSVMIAMVEAPNGPRSSGSLKSPDVKPQAPDIRMMVFGIPLGQKLNVSECPKMKIGKSLMYAGPARMVCFKRGYDRENESGPLSDGYVSIEFPVLELPLGVTGGAIMGTIIDGRLEGVAISTGGLSTQELMLEKLKEKYGEPALVVPRKVQNRMGASFETFIATWSFEYLTVIFNSVEGRLDHGLITIDTKKGSDYRTRVLKELLKDRRPL